MNSVRTNQNCLMCDGENIQEVLGFEDLLRVTSDSRIWRAGGNVRCCMDCGTAQKCFDDTLSKECNEIYESYQLYHQGEGGEQKCFIGGIGQPRSKLLINALISPASSLQAIDIDFHGTWLDVGCGRGDLLKNLSEMAPNWRLYGSDLSENNRAEIESIENVESYYSSDLSNISESFDVITLSHVLEHVPDPVSLMTQIKEHLNENGIILINVPNWLKNPFDILIADHLTHFSVKTLERLVRSSGFEIISLSDASSPKELVLIARKSQQKSFQNNNMPHKNNPEVKHLQAVVSWLGEVIEWSNEYVEANQVGVFGTALSATWLDKSSDTKFSFFVDEDPQRAGVDYLGRHVYSPKDAPKGSSVLVPLVYNLANNICQRLDADKLVWFHPPPILNSLS